VIPLDGPAESGSGELPDGNTQLAPDVVPIPMSIETVGFSVPFAKVSVAAVSTAVTVPPVCPTVNGTDTIADTPPTGAGMVPEYGIVLMAGELGVTGVLEPLSHAAAPRHALRRTPETTAIRRVMCTLPDAQQALATPCC
jgi:hypothetical protein